MILVLAGTVWAASPELLTGQGAATGGAVGAHAHDNSALAVNPAALGLFARYTFTGQGGLVDGRDYRLGITAVDGQTTPGLVFGLSYHRWRTTGALTVDELPGWVVAGEGPPDKRRYDQFTLGVAFPAFEGRLAAGLQGQLTYVDHQVLGRQFTGDLTAGLAARPTREWSVALAARNLLPRFFATDPVPSGLAATRYAWSDNTAVAVDVEVPISVPEGAFPVALRAGAEWGDVSRELNAGWRLEGPLREHWVSVGAGLWSDPETSPDQESRAGFHYAAQVPLHDLGGVGKNLLGIVHTITLTVEPKAR
jgi:hypothetical protein